MQRPAEVRRRSVRQLRTSRGAGNVSHHSSDGVALCTPLRNTLVQLRLVPRARQDGRAQAAQLLHCGGADALGAARDDDVAAIQAPAGGHHGRSAAAARGRKVVAPHSVHTAPL